jgi:ferredoxin-NADP reductase
MNTAVQKKNNNNLFRMLNAAVIGSVISHVVLFAYVLATSNSIAIAGTAINQTVLVQSLLVWGILFTVGYSFTIVFKFSAGRPTVTVDKPAVDKWQQQLQSVVSNLEEQYQEHKWKGFRQFVIDKRISECPDHSIVSFYLKPYDGGVLPRFKPGQHLAFRLNNITGQSKSIVRCYSLSDSYHPDYYRISIKRVPAPPDRPDLPPGISSNFFHDHLKVGYFLDVRAPSGNFYLDINRNTDSVLIAGGVGITPALSMLNTLIEAGSKTDIWFFYGVINSEQHAMKEHLEKIVQNHDHVHLIVCYSRPLDTDVLNEDYHYKGRVSVDLFKQLLPSNNYEYYMCGPGPMMSSVTEGLKEWGVPDKHVHLEAFGPASVPKKSKPKSEDTVAIAKVEFQVSENTLNWTGAEDSLLEFAEANGVELPSGCRMGNCGSCMTAIVSGEVDYPNGKPGFEYESGNCLPCVCVPKGNVTLEA